MHPLVTAFARVERAEEHIGDAERRLNDFRQAEYDRLRAEFNDPNRFPTIISQPYGKPVPDDICIRISEALFNLRAALDYMVFYLSWSDCGRPRKRTQFPIESTPEVFKSSRVHYGYLQGVNDAHVAMIAPLQPCNGCYWTAQLADFNNADKHRDLVFMVSRHEGPVTSVDPDSPEGQTGRPVPGSRRMRVQYEPVIHVELPNGLDAITTLYVIKNQVANTLETFQPEIRLDF